MVICEYYQKQETGVDRFHYGEDYRPDMPDDQSNIVNEKHIFGLMYKKKAIQEYSDPILAILSKMKQLKEKDSDLTNNTIANKFGELIIKPICTLTQEDLDKIKL